MSLPEANINNTGSLSKFLTTIKTAGVPERVTFEFLKTLGFKSSNDRPIITILKGIGFLDANGAPTDLYKAYRGHDSAKILGKALQSAYSDIFLAHTQAQSLSFDKLKGIIASKSTKGNPTVERIARTFQTLAKAADFSGDTNIRMYSDSKPESSRKEDEPSSNPENDLTSATKVSSMSANMNPAFHYNLEIHLPTTTDITVYNAIFKSLKENLL